MIETSHFALSAIVFAITSMSAYPSSVVWRPPDRVRATDRTPPLTFRIDRVVISCRSNSDRPSEEFQTSLSGVIVNVVRENSSIRRLAPYQPIATTIAAITTATEKIIRKCMGCDLLLSNPNIAAIGRIRSTGRKAPRRIRFASDSLSENDSASGVRSSTTLRSVCGSLIKITLQVIQNLRPRLFVPIHGVNI